MPLSALIPVFVMLLIPSGEQPENPWKMKVPEVLVQSELALRKALDVTWRADDWQTGLRLGQAAQAFYWGERGVPDRLVGRTGEQDQPAEAPALTGRIVRALWRGGRLPEAERLAALIPPRTSDRVALRALIAIHLSRAENQRAAAVAERLLRLPDLTAEDLFHVVAVRLATNELEGVADLLRRAERALDPDDGYPQTYLAESVEGVADFLDAVGTEPLNQVEQAGTAPMPPLVMMNLPSCDVMINGHGPYRMVVDTGGSVMLAVDTAVARDAGLESVATGSVRGVSGKTESGQALVDELQIGTIRCRRVMTRVFDVRSAIMNAADGIIGTGIFSGARMTLDFEHGQLIVGPSGRDAGAGVPVEVRLISDAKLMVPITLDGQPAMGLLDTGADVVAVSPSRLRELFPGRALRTFDVGMAVGVGAGDTPEIAISDGVELRLGERTFERYSGLGLDILDTILGPVLGVRTDVIIGMPTFRETNSCTVDYPTGQLWIDWLPAGERTGGE